MTNLLLPAEDIEYLSANFSNWQPLSENSKKGILIPDYQLPNGYIPKKSELMIIIPSDYPTAKIDMFYFCPDIKKKDGTDIAALNTETHFQRNWQRWSRHYDWRAGIDNIATHISYIYNQLKFEIDKG
ncbi:MAG: hypothetical protein OXM55_03475 [Bdellovibrionales bacterium]|nr:hypothetical protein [Bdellovibrionales bacterium]